MRNLNEPSRFGAGRVLLQQHRLHLPPLDGKFHRLGNQIKMGNQGCWFLLRVILPIGNKKVLLSCHQATNILCCTGQPIVGGNGNQQRARSFV